MMYIAVYKYVAPIANCKWKVNYLYEGILE